MSRSARSAVVVVLLVGAVAAGPVGVITASAANSTSTATTATGADGAGGTHNVSLQLSPTLRITSWRFEDGKFHVTVRNELPTTVEISDSGKVSQVLAEGSGPRAVKIPDRDYTLTTGTHTLTYRPTMHDGAAAVTIAGPDGSALLRTDSIRASKPPVERSAVQLLVVGTAAVVGFLGVTFVKRRRDDEKTEMERLA